MAEDELQKCYWLECRGRDVASAYLVPALEGRRNTYAGLALLLTNEPMHTSGFSTERSCYSAREVGRQEADELRIPAYLEASDVGYGLNARLGFEKIDKLKTVIDGELVEEYPAMLTEAATKSLT